MDIIANETTSHTVEPHGNVSEHFKNNNTNINTSTTTTSTLDTTDAEDTSAKHRHCVSLPLYYDQVSCGIWFLTLKLLTVSKKENKTKQNLTPINHHQRYLWNLLNCCLLSTIFFIDQKNVYYILNWYVICEHFSLFLSSNYKNLSMPLNLNEWELILSFPERIFIRNGCASI